MGSEFCPWNVKVSLLYFPVNVMKITTAVTYCSTPDVIMEFSDHYVDIPLYLSLLPHGLAMCVRVLVYILLTNLEILDISLFNLLMLWLVQETANASIRWLMFQMLLMLWLY